MPAEATSHTGQGAAEMGRVSDMSMVHWGWCGGVCRAEGRREEVKKSVGAKEVGPLLPWKSPAPRQALVLGSALARGCAGLSGPRRAVLRAQQEVEALPVTC